MRNLTPPHKVFEKVRFFACAQNDNAEIRLAVMSLCIEAIMLEIFEGVNSKRDESALTAQYTCHPGTPVNKGSSQMPSAMT